jgi:hypothetical protein
LTHAKLMAIGGLVGIAYCSWAIGHFFGKNKILNYVKALFAYILGMVTFTLTALLLGLFIDWLVKQP